MSYPPFTDVAATVDRFLEILGDHGIDLHGASEVEALAMLEVLEMWRNPAVQPADPRPIVRRAMGFVDLAGKVVSVVGHPDFHQLMAHLQMLAKTTALQNSASPVTDSAGNKVIELYIAALAMTFGTDIELDHPEHSKGDNPDVMLTFRGERWALALKTLHSRKPQTIFDNIKKASDQIEASTATRGLVILNVKNELDYDRFWPLPASPLPEAVVAEELSGQMQDILQPLDQFSPSDWLKVFGPARKAEIPIVLYGQAGALALPKAGGHAHFMALKGVVTYLTPSDESGGAMKLVKELHHASQQFH